MPLPRFAVVDLETSGFSVRRHRILQVGIVVIEADGCVLDEWSTLVKLRWPLQRVGPTDVHGITRRMLAHAPRIDDVLAEVGQRLDGAVFTAHNAEFDAAFLVRAARRRSGLDLGPRLCTLRMSRRLDPDRLVSHRLSDVCERYGIVIERPHDALADAAATAAILPHLIAAHGITDDAELVPFFDRS
ncbi:MAG: 3'-5' exonuclease [Ilumatobacter sp.]|nr:3'-5' exonuclease [Ilumatobacter sp.]